jgi:hypothetical protein
MPIFENFKFNWPAKLSSSHLYFLLASYEIWVYWVCVGKNGKENIAEIHVLGLFIATKHDLSKNHFVCHAPVPIPLNAKFVPRLQPRPFFCFSNLILSLNSSEGAKIFKSMA